MRKDAADYILFAWSVFIVAMVGLAAGLACRMNDLAVARGRLDAARYQMICAQAQAAYLNERADYWRQTYQLTQVK